jgi:hypothetical protein
MLVMSMVNCDDSQVRAFELGGGFISRRRISLNNFDLWLTQWTLVTWSGVPFESHSDIIPFNLIGMYSGGMRWCGIVVPHLPERCIRQFGYVQYIPPLPPVHVTIDIDSDWIYYILLWSVSLSWHVQRGIRPKPMLITYHTCCLKLFGNNIYFSGN